MPMPLLIPETAGWRRGQDMLGEGCWVVDSGPQAGMPLALMQNSKKLAFMYYKLRRMDKNAIPDGLLDAIKQQWREVVGEHAYDVSIDYLDDMDIDKPFIWDAY